MSPRFRITLTLLTLGLLSPMTAPAQEAVPAAPPSAVPDKPPIKRIAVPIKKSSKALERAKAVAARRKKESGWLVRRPTEALRPIPELGPVPFPPGEKLTYKISMFNQEAATTVLSVGSRTAYGETPSIQVTGLLKGSPFINKFYPIDDRIDVQLDERTFLPLETRFHLREAGKELQYDTRYYQIGLRLNSTRTRGAQKLVRSFRPATRIYEPLAAIYGLRRLKLEPKAVFDFYIWDGRRERLVTAKVIGQEKVYTPVGWFDAMKVEVSTKITGGFVTEADLDLPPRLGTIWVGLDANRTPVKLLTPTKLGDAEVVLVHRVVEGVPDAPAAPVSAGPTSDAPKAPKVPAAPASKAAAPASGAPVAVPVQPGK